MGYRKGARVEVFDQKLGWLSGSYDRAIQPSGGGSLFYQVKLDEPREFEGSKYEVYWAYPENVHPEPPLVTLTRLGRCS